MIVSKGVGLHKPITYKPKHAIIQDLVDFINRRTPIINNEKTKKEEVPLKVYRLALFNWAIETAIEHGKREMEAEHITDLDSYLKFADDFVEWTPTVSSKGDEVLRKILVLYWPFNQQQLSDLQTPIAPAFTDTDLRWLSYWLVAYARRLGEYMSTPESVGNIWSFYTSHKYGQGPDDADKGTKYDKGDRYSQWKVPEGGWKSFNQWFSREWADIDYSRPLDGEGNDKLIVQGADSVFNGFWDINEGIVHIDPADPKSAEVCIKTKGIDWPIKDLVRAIDGGETYKNGSFTHAFLGPTDYHRQHAPVEGKVVLAKNIQEQVYLQVAQSKTVDGKTTICPVRDIVMSPQELQRRYDNTTRIEEKTNSNSQEKLLARYRLNNNLEENQSEQPSANGPKPGAGITAPDHAGYQWCQTRGLIVIDTSYDSKGNKKSVDHGMVAVLPIGMAQVSSVVLTVEEGQFLEKGQNISYFQFGGSDIVTVFQKRPTYRDGLQAGTTKLHIREKLAEWE
ncbi:phosphatidylserine decarboxylase-domain-containing protein [Aspergillus alliaceus]|uniref:Phosphatidylserine decarboxylase-domain-containing protein n=1 Tax=Petromyces alliaceus TaxID=209559 RepID=A0A5N7C0I4_PETAA|nr:phosphatidylserine decarboxylase-domain-containing protein [Aspergillus alliaceus]